MGDVSIAVHQPNYLPWLGYFHKLSRVDTFVFLDNVQFARRGYTHRVHVMGPAWKSLWITQNIRKRAVDEQVIQDIAFSDMFWVDKHLKTFEAAYGKTPHFDEIIAFLERGLHADEDGLARFNGGLIQSLAAALGISTRILYASDLPIRESSSPSERIALIAAHFGATVYLSGAGAKSYNDEVVFGRYGVALAYNDFTIAPYPQRRGGADRDFIGGLSVVDALFNVGFDGTAALLGLPHCVHSPVSSARAPASSRPDENRDLLPSV